MRSMTIGELKKIFEKYDDETEVCYECEGGHCSISVVYPTKDNNDETILVLE